MLQYVAKDDKVRRRRARHLFQKGLDAFADELGSAIFGGEPLPHPRIGLDGEQPGVGVGSEPTAGKTSLAGSEIVDHRRFREIRWDARPNPFDARPVQLRFLIRDRILFDRYRRIACFVEEQIHRRQGAAFTAVIILAADGIGVGTNPDIVRNVSARGAADAGLPIVSRLPRRRKRRLGRCGCPLWFPAGERQALPRRICPDSYPTHPDPCRSDSCRTPSKAGILPDPSAPLKSKSYTAQVRVAAAKSPCATSSRPNARHPLSNARGWAPLSGCPHPMPRRSVRRLRTRLRRRWFRRSTCGSRLFRRRAP